MVTEWTQSNASRGQHKVKALPIIASGCFRPKADIRTFSFASLTTTEVRAVAAPIPWSVELPAEYGVDAWVFDGFLERGREQEIPSFIVLGKGDVLMCAKVPYTV